MNIQTDTIVSILIGGSITWIAAHAYYVLAAKEMAAESKKLRNLQRISLQAMEDTGMVELNRDASGEIIGMAHNLSFAASSSLVSTVNLSVLDEVKASHDSK